MAIAQTIQLVGFANVVAFFLALLYLGGDASMGKVADGHYFLSSHGHLTEVSRAVFRYSEVHGSIVVWSLPIMFIAMGWGIHLRTLMRRRT